MVEASEVSAIAETDVHCLDNNKEARVRWSVDHDDWRGPANNLSTILKKVISKSKKVRTINGPCIMES